MSVEPCPSCKQPPVILENTKDGTFSIACPQVFLRRRPDDAECKTRPAMMEYHVTRDRLIEMWNAHNANA